MLTTKHKTFVLESYFRNDIKPDNEDWEYSVQACFDEFRERFPVDAANVIYQDIHSCVTKLVRDVTETGNIERKTRSGRPTKRTAKVTDNVRVIIKATPSNLIWKLRQEVHLS